MAIFSTSADDTTKEQRNFVQRSPEERERLATLAGTSKSDLRAATTKTKTKTGYKNVGARSATKGRDAVKGVRTKVTRTSSKFDQISFDQAIKDFAARGGNDSKVEAQAKASGGGSGASKGSFEQGAITAPGIVAQEFGVDSNTPVNSKQRGR